MRYILKLLRWPVVSLERELDEYDLIYHNNGGQFELAPDVEEDDGPQYDEEFGFRRPS